MLTPRTAYVHDRPVWMSLGGRRRLVEVPVAEAVGGWCFLEARVAGEPAEAVPLDACEVRDAPRAWLFVPPDEAVSIQVFNEAGELLRTERLGADQAPQGD